MPSLGSELQFNEVIDGVQLTEVHRPDGVRRASGYPAACAWRMPFPIAAPCALIGTSKFFELAVATGLYGLGSSAALATVVGVLVEVPVMLSLVVIANATRSGFQV